MNVGYIRVSTVEQNEARQLEGLSKYPIEKFFTEKVSGKDTNREQLKAMLEFVREGDTIYVHDLSRLSRSLKDLLGLVETLNQKGVHLVSNKENINSSTASGKLMLTMIGAINQFELDNLKERQLEGIAVQKERDKERKPQDKKYKGRKAISIDEEQLTSLLEEYNSRKLNKTQLAEALGVSRPTLYKILKNKQYAL